MECPKCHKNIPDDSVNCPFCHKVLSLVCPNCHTIGLSSVCENCGFIILTKCSKCKNTISTTQTKCNKCGFPTSTSLSYQECESDEFAAITVKFENLKKIKNLIKSKELFSKFKIKLKNLFTSLIKNNDGNTIEYNDVFVINFNKELSFATSANKAIRTALKILNAFSSLNSNIIEEFDIPLNMHLTILKKTSEELLINKTFKTNVKPLLTGKAEEKYLKGFQILLDEYTQDVISKDYKTDSLYTIEENGKTIVFYEVKLKNYILPPDKENDSSEIPVNPSAAASQETAKEESDEDENLFNLNTFNIKTKCSFETSPTKDIYDYLLKNKIIALKGKKLLQPKTSDLIDFYKIYDKKIIKISCSEELKFKPWGLLEEIFKQYCNLSVCKNFIPDQAENDYFQNIWNLIFNKARKAHTPEDARFAYMDDFIKFLSCAKNTVIIIEDFENIDNTTLQTLNIFFENYRKTMPDFLFITNSETPVHSKINNLLRNPLYTEIKLVKNKMEGLISNIKEDASDFIKSFYYEKINSIYNGSLLFFENSIQYLKEKDVLLSFENKLLVKKSDSVFLSSDFEGLIRSRLKMISKNTEASMILAYLTLINSRIDYPVLNKLEIKNVKKEVEYLKEAGLVFEYNNCVFLNNYDILKPIILSGLKKNIIEFLSKNIFAKLGKGLDNTIKILLIGKLDLFKDEYLLLWKNSSFAISTGDFDAYLKNTRGFLSLIEQIKGDIEEDTIDEHKKEIYKNILFSLYSYSPEKIYDIEQILLDDALAKNDKENTIKLSNLMLQGALINQKYDDAKKFLNTLLKNLPNPVLITNGEINHKFFLLMLVNIEILFNIGDLQTCIDISNELLDNLTPEIIEKIKPASFSVNLFAEHLMNTFRLGALAHILSLNNNLDTYTAKIKVAVGEELPDKENILAIRDFLNGKNIDFTKAENSSSFAKVFYLIMQEFSQQEINYKLFAENIYQAKLLASDINQNSLKLLCELLIGYAYSKVNTVKKAESIYKDIIKETETNGNANIMLLAKFLLSKLKAEKKETENALLLINDSIAFIQSNAPKENLIYALFKNLTINIAEAENLNFIDIETEKNKLLQYIANEQLSRIIPSQALPVE